MISRRFFSVLVLVAAACTSISTETTSPTESPVMSAPRQESPTIRYRLRLVQDPEPAIDVSVELSWAPGESTRFGLDQWGGVQDPERSVHDVQAFDGSAQPLAVTASGRGWEVDHSPDQAFRLTYRLRSGAEQTTGESNTYRPVINRERMHLLGPTALLYPRAFDASKLPIEVIWEGFDTAGWSVVQSYSAATDSFSVQANLRKFRHSVFYAGDIRLVARDTPRGRVQLALAGTDWKFTDDELADLAARIVDYEREFFDDPGEPYYLITLMPVGSAGSGMLGGTGLTQSFAMFANPGQSLIPVEGRADSGFGSLLVHEMFHSWNGAQMRIDLGEREGGQYWFSEGFTDFYTLRILYRMGLMDEAGYRLALNDVVAAYALNPAVDKSNQIVVEAFWTDRNVSELPYQRGFVVALLLEYALRQKGGPRLDDLMRALLAQAREQNGNLSEAEVFARFAEFAGDEVANRLRQLIENGGMPSLPDDVLAPCFALRSVKKPQFVSGFDVDGSIDAGVVTGVVEGSAAFKAGLRDGQLLKHVDVSYGNPSRPMRFTVEDGGKSKKVEYLPAGDLFSVPEFVAPKAGLDPTACADVL